jgi:hypothetical protein
MSDRGRVKRRGRQHLLRTGEVVHMSESGITDDVAMTWLRATFAANDRDNILWPPENVKFASDILRKARGRVPSIDEVVSEVGELRAQDLLSIIFDQRKFVNRALGFKSPCHYCGSADDLMHYDFALMNVETTARSWGQTAASLALSAALMPVLGGGAIRLPGKVWKGAAIHLRLVACKSCRAENSNIFGAFTINKKRAAMHPLWNDLTSSGFTKFLCDDKLPDDFRYRAFMKL